MRPRDSGRAAGFSLGLVVGLLLLGYAALRVLELSPRSSPPALERHDSPAELPTLGTWHARVGFAGAGILARLLPLHDEPALQEFRAGTLRRRFALPEGRPWRLYLSLEAPAAQAVFLRSARVSPDLAPFAELARSPEGVDPVYALLAAAPGLLEEGRTRPMVLWGVSVAEGVELELELEDETGAGVTAAGRLERDPDASEPTRWYAGQSPPRRDARPLAEEVARLRAELDQERARRAERELAFDAFSRKLAELPAGRQLGLSPEPGPSAGPTAEELERRLAEETAVARAEEIGRALAVLMRLEGLRGLDLMEAGTLQAGPPSAIGPVVFRCLDERGLLAGSVRAERLRLEGSVSAHTLTLVLEDGFESRGGERVPFEGGRRRITLREVDPEPWLKDCPELFESATLTGAGDDGLWRLADVRREFNRLLALDTRMGWYRLHSLGGVRGERLLDVQLEELDEGGRRVRRVFADTLVLALEDGGVVLDLRDGAWVRGDEKQPFRDGRHRIVLPGGPLESWRAAVLPGMGPPPGSEKPREGGPAGG